MKTRVVAMLHHGFAGADKVDKAADAFWWPGMYRKIQKKSESKNLKTQIPSSEKTL